MRSASTSHLTGLHSCLPSSSGRSSPSSTPPASSSSPAAPGASPHRPQQLLLQRFLSGRRIPSHFSIFWGKCREKREKRRREEARRQAPPSGASTCGQPVRHLPSSSGRRLLHPNSSTRQQQPAGCSSQLAGPPAAASQPPKPPAGCSSSTSSIRHNTAVIKKLKQINEEQREGLLEELRSVNLNKFVSEAVAAICDAKLKTSDIQAAVQACSLLHERYKDFSPCLIQGLLKAFSPGKSGDDLDADKSLKAMKKRSSLELLTVGFITTIYSTSPASTTASTSWPPRAPRIHCQQPWRPSSTPAVVSICSSQLPHRAKPTLLPSCFVVLNFGS